MNSRPLPNFLRFALPRGLALFLGGFALANLLNSFRSARFDATGWWLDLRGLPPRATQGLVLLSAVILIAFGARQPASTWRRLLTAGCAALLGMAALGNTAEFYFLLARGSFHTGCPVPLSLWTAAALGLIAAAALQPNWLRPKAGGRFPVLAVSLGCAVLFPLGQMFCFGLSDYRRAADAAVVFGARVYADGRPSDALADRVRTACQLYRQGQTRKLILSGGPGDGAIHETEAMRRQAIGLGVKPEDILVDEGGWNTWDTVRNTEPMLRQLGASRVLVVSHFYHLPRIKLAYQRAGREVYTVPARESRLLGQLPYNMAREVAAFWSYYLRA